MNPLSNAVVNCVTKDAENVAETSATLCGHLSVEDGFANVASVWFIIGDKESTLEATGKKVVANNIKLVDGAFDGDIEAKATDLLKATTYFYIACASVDGKIGKGNVKSFTTGGSGDTPGGDTPGGDTPGGDTPGGDTPGGDTPGGDTPGGGGEQDKPSVEISTGASGRKAPHRYAAPIYTEGCKASDGGDFAG